MIIKPNNVASLITRVKKGCGSNRRSVLYAVQDGICFWHFHGQCCYNGEPMATHKMVRKGADKQKLATFEHLKEFSKGGDNSFENVVLAHRKCNSERNRKDSRVKALRSRLKSYFGIPLKATKWMER